MFLTNGIKVLRTTYINAMTTRYRYRGFATEKNSYVSVTVDPEFDGSVAVVTMQKKPVNALCSNLYRELIKTIDDLENNENMRGMILTSAFPGVFSAGLDFNALLDATLDDIHKLNKDFHDLTLKLYGSRLITIAALNGHSMAGGALMAVTADYRVMAEGSYRIGLNETQIGLFLPSYLKQMVENVIGSKATARALQLSLVFTSAEACKLGLVEEVTPMDQVMTAARREVKQWLEIPDSARASMKMELRRKVIQEMINRKEEDAKTFASTMASPEFQMRLRSIVNNMKRK